MTEKDKKVSSKTWSIRFKEILILTKKMDDS